MSTAMMELTKPITHEELAKALNSLKNNNTTDPDQICNEAIKAFFEGMKNVYLKLFHCTFDSENFPEGLIDPIYKRQGGRVNPNG